MEQLDSFIEYLYTVEETLSELTTAQVKKLQSIQTKVSELVNKIQEPQLGQPASQPQIQVRSMELQLAENKVQSFSDYTELNEKIVKRGNHWVVMNKNGTKVLGEHPSREKAVKQLQAIEISKAKHAG
jgi:hypothetical protein